MNTKAAQAIQTKINKAADLTIRDLHKHAKGDMKIAIAACAVAMCALARADGMLFHTVQEAVHLAFDQVNSD